MKYQKDGKKVLKASKNIYKKTETMLKYRKQIDELDKSISHVEVIKRIYQQYIKKVGFKE